MDKIIIELIKLHGAVKVFRSYRLDGDITYYNVLVKISDTKYRIYDIQCTGTFIINSDNGFNLDSAFIEYSSYEDMVKNSREFVELQKIHSVLEKYYNLILSRIESGINDLENTLSVLLYKSPEPTFVVYYKLNNCIQQPVYFYPCRNKVSEDNSFTNQLLGLLEGENFNVK